MYVLIYMLKIIDIKTSKSFDSASPTNSKKMSFCLDKEGPTLKCEIPNLYKTFCENYTDPTLDSSTNFDIVKLNAYFGNHKEIKKIVNDFSTFPECEFKNEFRPVNDLFSGKPTPQGYRIIIDTIDFYDKINTEMFLIFQTDTLISNKYSKLIYNFIEYDYVGAPWINGCVGNGGLSFRKTNKMKEILNNTSYYYIKNNNEELMNEDIFFSNNEEVFFKTDYIKETNNNIDKNNFINNNVYKPSLDEAKFFSVESIYNNMSFGLHKPWLYLNNNELDDIKKIFPELDLLYKLQ